MLEREWTETTARAAVRFAAGKGTAGLVAPPVAGLAESVLAAMLGDSFKVVALTVISTLARARPGLCLTGLCRGDASHAVSHLELMPAPAPVMKPAPAPRRRSSSSRLGSSTRTIRPRLPSPKSRRSRGPSAQPKRLRRTTTALTRPPKDRRDHGAAPPARLHLPGPISESGRGRPAVGENAERWDASYSSESG